MKRTEQSFTMDGALVFLAIDCISYAAAGLSYEDIFHDVSMRKDVPEAVFGNEPVECVLGYILNTICHQDDDLEKRMSIHQILAKLMEVNSFGNIDSIEELKKR
jgi:hypothetical protein